MYVTYNNLFKLLIDKGLNKTEFAREVGISSNTLAKLSSGITDTPVTLAAKAHLRNGRPLIIAPSTNDALSNAAKNIGVLLNCKNIYFVPFRQDNSEKKPCSMVAEFTLIEQTLEDAFLGVQTQPVIIAPK